MADPFGSGNIMQDLWLVGRRCLKAVWAWCWAAWLWPLVALAQPAAPPQAQKVTRLEVQWTVHSAERVERVATRERQALSPAGAGLVGVDTLSFNGETDTLEVLDAYTLKADGRRVPVDRAAIVRQQGLLGGERGITLPRWETWQIKFPDVQAGDRTVLKTREVRSQAMLPGWWAMAQPLPPLLDMDQVVVELRAPRALGLQVQVRRWDGRHEVEGDMERWRFETRVRASPLDAGAVNLSEHLPAVFASTFKRHEQLGEAFAARFEPMSQPSAQVRAVAEALALGPTRSTAERVVASHDWVRRNIRYSAVFLGQDGWVPQGTDETLKSRLGDCKAHVLLLVALLRAQGIEAQPALINTLPQYEPLPVPTGYNHVIVHVPSLRLYLDPTASALPAGQLPLNEYGKPVLLSSTRGASLARVPLPPPAHNRLLLDTQLQVHADGSATGTLEVSGEGAALQLVQAVAAQLPPAQDSEPLRRLLEQGGYRGSGSVTLVKPEPPGRPRPALRLSFELNDFLRDPDAGAVPLQPPLRLGLSIADNVGGYQSERREFPRLCLPMAIEERLGLTFDRGHQLPRPPRDLQLQLDGLVFQARHTLQDGALTVLRTLQDARSSPVCAPAEYQARRPVMGQIAANLRQQLVYQKQP